MVVICHKTQTNQDEDSSPNTSVYSKENSSSQKFRQ